MKGVDAEVAIGAGDAAGAAAGFAVSQATQRSRPGLFVTRHTPHFQEPSATANRLARSEKSAGRASAAAEAPLAPAASRSSSESSVIMDPESSESSSFASSEAAAGVAAGAPEAEAATPPRLNCSTRGCDALTPALIAPLRMPRACTTPWPASFAPVGRLSCAQATRQSPAAMPAARDSEPEETASTTTLPPPGPSRSDRPRGVRVTDTVIVLAGPVAAATIGAAADVCTGVEAATGAIAEVPAATALPPRLN